MNTKDFQLKTFEEQGMVGLSKHVEELKKIEKIEDKEHKSAFLAKIGDLMMEAVIAEENDEILIEYLTEVLGNGKLTEDELMDIFWMTNVELSPSGKTQTEDEKRVQGRLSYLLLDFVNQKLIDETKVMIRMENQLLGECGLVELKNFQRRQLRFMTKLLYEQHKYNLFREESEGFSKLIVQLLQIDDNSSPQIVKENLNSLIGYFDLDPNRVVDVIIESFMHNSTCNIIYIEVLKSFKREYIPQILGFRFQKYGKAVDCGKEVNFDHKTMKDILSEESTTPQNLYKVTAKLIKAGLVFLHEVWPHLSPGDEIIQSEFSRRSDAGYHFLKENYVQRMTITTEQIRKEKEDNLSLKKYLKSQYPRNQKFWILEALLRQNDLTNFMKGWKAIGDNIDLSSHVQLKNALMDLISWFIEPCYRHLSPSFLNKKKIKLFLFCGPRVGCAENEITQIEVDAKNIFKSTENVEQYLKFLKKLQEILRLVRGYLYSDPILFAKICRILISLKKQMTVFNDQDMKDEGIIPLVNQLDNECLNILKMFLIPSLPGFDASPGIVSYIWTILANYSFLKRYEMYDHWLLNEIAINPQITNFNGEATRSSRMFMKIIRNDKEVDKINARLFAKLSHGSPLIVFNEALSQMKQFDNMIPIIITSFNYCSNLSLDIAVFLTLRSLSEMKKRILKEKEGVIEAWFNNMAHFLGLLLKKHYKIDLEGIFVFLCNRLASDEDNHSLNIVIFRELIENMSGYSSFTTPTDIQLKSLSGGIALQTEAFRLAEQVRSAKKSSKALAEFFWKEENKMTVYSNNSGTFSLSLPFYLLALIAKQRNRMIYKSRYNNPAVINNLYDIINNCIQQFDLFLQYHSGSSSHFLELLPENSLDILVDKWKINPEIAFHIVRKSLLSINKVSEEQWNILVSNYKKVHDNFNYESFYDSKGIADKKISAYIIQERKKLWNVISPDLYALFWILKPEHISVPTDAYSAQINEMEREIKAISSNPKGESKSKINKDIDRIKRNISILKQEKNTMNIGMRHIQEFLESKKEKVFHKFSFDLNKLTPFIQFCLLPRLRMSAKDSIFCVRFVEMIHNLRKSSFLDQVVLAFNFINVLLPSIQCSSENEAYNLGVFFREILGLTKNCHNDNQFYQDIQKVNERGSSKDKSGNQSFKKVRLVILCLFKTLTTKFEGMLNSQNFMQLRNIVIILSGIISVYPGTKSSANKIINAFKKRFSGAEEIKGSLKVQAQSFKVALMNRKSLLPSVDEKKLKDQLNKESRKSSESKNKSSKMSKQRMYNAGKGSKKKHNINRESKEKPKRRDDKKKRKGDERRDNDRNDRRDRRPGNRESRPRHKNRKYDNERYLNKRKDYKNDHSEDHRQDNGQNKKLKIDNKGYHDKRKDQFGHQKHHNSKNNNK